MDEFELGVTNYCWGLTGKARANGLCNKNYRDADDLIQETILKALKYRNQFTPGTNVGAWCNTIMLNTFKNRHSEKKRRPVIVSEFPEDISDEVVYNEVEVKHDNQAAEVQRRQMYSMIADLPDDLSKPIKLMLTGNTIAQISVKLDIKTTTVESRLKAAKKLLKERV